MTNAVSQNITNELPHIWRFAVRLTRSQSLAEDLVQKTAVRALERSHQFVVGSKLRSWLFSIMHSIWKNDLRAEQLRRESISDHSELEGYKTTVCSGELNQHFNDVVSEVSGLPDAQRIVMLLVCVEGYSYQEVSDILDVKVGTVMSRLARARLTIGRAFIDAEPANVKKRGGSYER